jgi:hypothetical protein
MSRKIILFVITVLFSCEKDIVTCNPPDDLPACLRKITEQDNPPIEIWGYWYQNQIVYLAIGDCCDQYDQVYSSDCGLLCAPSGGFSGKGDGKCPDFYDKATKGTLVWKKE